MSSTYSNCRFVSPEKRFSGSWVISFLLRFLELIICEADWSLYINKIRVVLNLFCTFICFLQDSLLFLRIKKWFSSFTNTNRSRLNHESLNQGRWIVKGGKLLRAAELIACHPGCGIQANKVCSKKRGKINFLLSKTANTIFFCWENFVLLSYSLLLVSD